MNKLHSLPSSLDVTRTVLENGITVLVRTNMSSPSIMVNGYLPAGSLFDPENKIGIASFTASMLTRGTRHHTFTEIFDQLESAAANLSFGGNAHTTGFNLRCLVEDLPAILDLFHEVLTEPTFPVEQMEKMRTQILTSLAIMSQDTGEMAGRAFDEILFVNHPYRFQEIGYPETVAAITRDDLVDFHRRCYGPNGMVIVMVGAISADEAVELIRSRLSGWKNSQQPAQPVLPPITPLQTTIRRNTPLAGKSQADIVMGCIGPTRRSPDYMACSLGNNILGVFGMMGRIGDIVREQSGLAYYAYTSLNSGSGPGTWLVSAGVNPTNTDKAIELAKSEIRRFIYEPVSDEELGNSKANFIGRLPLSLESNLGVASTLLNMERYDLGLDYLVNYADMVNQITPIQILEAARKYLDPEVMAIGVAGP